ncbi:lysosomal cobalamin transport escort protein LMBD1 [Danio rerio]|uniref:Lysosomal cobalamin transport escort protein LMBD1 n=1 Tax=Danio rerio TaxID=7955 RepID=LMBD1_DANRE|nr:lysosomal cobalamin transport escort protein LMBD1 [Danio rerio]Q5PR61.1 RecName: Full=Lysosomal cobalamin transport escort protein LMBD1; Short=LMBD1; AltName: Full=LMBR1 domain-containing protein 1 [Danio rerio]AAH86815.1 Zgc:103471 [Danio rerio]|eukprot:NP_001008612.1 probable lysosomal cobalamin transporter [Danio rerio]
MATPVALLSESVLGWSIFTVVLLVILAFCWVYIRKYQSRQESEVISTITAICALAIALITSALLPVDIFLVSFMKHPNGTYKEWAANNETRVQIEDTVLYGYYTLYSIILFCVFLWIPFVYFYYEEKDEDNNNKCLQVKNALKYTIGFVIVCSALLLIGTFVPLASPPNQNSTQWQKVQYLFEELGSSHGLAALSFSISSLTLIGMLAVITYTAYGMSVLPLNLIKGTRSVLYERLENTEDTEEVERQIDKLKAKCADGRPLSMRDRRNLQDLEDKLQLLHRRGRHLEIAERNCCNKVGSALRPMKILLGVFFILVALLFFVTLFISNLDKALHSAGISTGFIIFGTNLTNPLNELLLALQPVFPLDYVLITVITMYFVFTSMAGIRNMGIWFFWIRLYKIRPQRTRPQALLFLCMILLLIVLHTSYMIYSLAPQYVMYGSQKYLLQTPLPTAVPSQSNRSATITKICDADAPEDQCTVTRSYLFLHKFWFFSTIYYFGNWAFLGVFLIGLVVSCCKGKKSVIEGEVDADDSDFSDDEYVH